MDYADFKERKIKTPIAIGMDLFQNFGNSYYVDKTLLVRDIIDIAIPVILFTRPRRFGKTLNMSMLQAFFEKPADGKDTSHYFKNLKIWQCGEKYTSEQGKRPVIMLSFKDMKMSSFELAYEKFMGKISKFSSEIIDRIIRKSAYRPAKEISGAIMDGEAADLEQYLSDFLLEMCSYLNLTEEKDYQHLIIGLCGTMRNGYAIHSEREAGHGRADIVFTPRLDYEEHDKLPGIIMELKHIKAEETEKDSPESIEAMLQDEAEEALRQIETKEYITDLKTSGVNRITKYGIAFSGKYVKVIRKSE